MFTYYYKFYSTKITSTPYLGEIIELVAHGVYAKRVLLVAHVGLQLMLCRTTILGLCPHLMIEILA